MRTGFRLAALGVAVVTLTLWFFGGPNLGWTRTRVPVSGEGGTRWEQRFLPGLDFVAGGLAITGILFAISFAFRGDHRSGKVPGGF